MPRPLTLAVAAMVLGIAAAAPASAAGSARIAERVLYADLNLDNRAGAEVMLRRIERAAGRVCGQRTGAVPLTFRARVERCMDEEIDEALADLDHGGVSALYYNRNPQVIISAR